MSIFTRLQNGWNAFIGRDPTHERSYTDTFRTSYSSGRRQDRFYPAKNSEKSVVNAVYNRIANDVAQVQIQHARMDQNGMYVETMNTKFNRCLSLEANIDQTGRAFILDLCLTLFDEGAVAVVPVDTTEDPYKTTSYDICTMRVGRIVEWFPDAVRVDLYDERTGQHKKIKCHKKTVAIIENPFYTVMNEPNSTAKRLIRKLNLIDMMDERNSSGKLDLIIKLPYVVKSEARRAQADARRKDIEKQLTSSQYGIAYTDGTEEIVQLNRPIENRLATQVKDLQADLYAQLGITQAILDETASEQQMLNYYSRTIEPILSAIADEFKRKFLSQTAITQGQSVWFFRNPFKLVPVDKVAAIADSFTRNEILTSNEVRAIVGYKPVNSQAANELRNKNLNQPAGEETQPAVVDDYDPNDPYSDQMNQDPYYNNYYEEEENQNGREI